jgi:hypothetical protein
MTIHSSTFDADERGIPLGVRVMSEVLWERAATEALLRPPSE